MNSGLAWLAVLVLAGCGSPVVHEPVAADATAAGWDELEAAEIRPTPVDGPIEEAAALLRQRLGLAPAPAASPQRAEVLAGSSAEQATLGLLDMVRLAAGHSSDYQQRKHAVFVAGLALDLGDGGFQRASTRMLAVDLRRLLEGTDAVVGGYPAEASVIQPLEQDAGDIVRADVLDPAERDVVYALFELEREKHELAVEVATRYLGALRSLDVMERQERLHRWLVGASRRAEREAIAQRLPQLVVERAAEEEAAARDAWIESIAIQRQELEALRRLAGLPRDTELLLDRRLLHGLDEAVRRRGALALERGGGSRSGPTRVPPEGVLALQPAAAVDLALRRRLDLRGAEARLLSADREAERRAGRSGRASSEAAATVRAQLQELVAAGIREGIQGLGAARDESQARWEELRDAEARVGATGFPRTDRVASADVRAAYAQLVAAGNAYVNCLVLERVAELALWRDLGVLRIDAEHGLWNELEVQAVAVGSMR